MSTSSRGAAIATAILAGTLGLASFMVMSAPAIPSSSAPSATSRVTGSAPRATQVRPTDVATGTPSPAVTVTPTPKASAAPTAQPVAVATPRPTAAPTPRATPRPTPASTPRPVIVVVTPPPTPAPTPTPAAPAVETTQLNVTVADGPTMPTLQQLLAGTVVAGTVLAQSGPLAGTTATTTTWRYAFTIDEPGNGMTFGVHVVGIWPFDPAALHSMSAQWTVVGTVGCNGNYRPIVNQNGIQPPTDSGDLDVIATNAAFYDSNLNCPLVASGVLTVTLSPAS